ncbi:MAG TPA: EamA family transporter [Gammaproteobacteria bacterium]|nr:EamA family transporter [Gammaproteobacteria bacterium]
MNNRVLSFVLQGLIAILCFASIPVAIRVVTADPMTIGLVRLIIAVIFGLVVLVKPAPLKQLTKQDWLWLAALGFSFGVHWLLYFYSIKIANASTAIVGVSSYGIQIILISIFFHGRPFFKTDGFAIVAVICGSALIVPEFSLENELTKGFLIAVVCAFFYAILPSIHQRNSHLSSGVRSFGQFLFAGVFFSFFIPHMNFDLPSLDWWGLAYLGVIGTLVAHTLWTNVVTHVSAVPASLIYYLSVPTAIFFGVFFLDEPLTWQLVVGTCLILSGNCLGIIHQLKKNSFFIENKA